MRIGVVSDTHNNLKNVAKIVDLFNASRVERVVHTGDITQAKTLDLLAGLDAPLYGVYGNNDVERDSLDRAILNHGFTFCEPPFTACWAQQQIIVVHDPREFNGHLQTECNLALHGHTHLYRLETWGKHTVMFNPGECAGMMTGLNAIGIVDLITLKTELLRF
ncbi:MAG: YfcE family phosphodiesterase [Gammaproteobacteria bacterium]|jgi:uncharacterized protein|nr:YfcE family phosphodiesterase [Gammaproteobacteria bacterium]MCH1551440.1 YfcE family phosphodiesterase [Pseudomonadales bacterium]